MTTEPVEWPFFERRELQQALFRSWDATEGRGDYENAERVKAALLVLGLPWAPLTKTVAEEGRILWTR